MAVAYGTQQAGEVLWPGLPAALSVVGRGGLAPYPVARNRTSGGGAPYTGVVTQYAGDGILVSHHIFAQLDAVKYQYGCFLATASATGVAIVPPPLPLGTPCPTL